MNEPTFYLLKKYYDAGAEGIEWHIMSKNIMQEHEYLDFTGNAPVVAHSFLVTNKYVEKVVDIPAQIFIITPKGIQAYIVEKDKNDIKDLELEKERKFKEQLFSLNQSVIDTNINVRGANDSQVKFQNKYLILTALTTLFILLTVYQQCRDKSVQQLQGIQKELQSIDTTLKHIQPFPLAKDSSMKR